MRKAIVGFGTGVLFAGGLVVSQMTLPERIIGFLDFFGEWDPTLMFVMGGAIGVYLPIWWVVRGRKAPVGGKVIPRKLRNDVDSRLLLGAGLFGIGWGMCGICPGPGIVLIGRPSLPTAVFILTVVAGMLLNRAMDGKTIRSSHKSAPA